MSQEAFVHEHLAYNIIPAMTELLPFAMLAIDAANNSEWDKPITFEEGGVVNQLTSRHDGHIATAKEIIEGLRLEAFVVFAEEV